jgi:hypothetical protein
LTTPANPTVVRPVSGSRRFRRNARLAVEDGALVATDRRGKAYRFPFDGTQRAPARFVETFASEESDGEGRFAYLDGSSQAIVIGLNGDWNHYEQTDFNQAAGIPEGLATSPLPALRADGCRIRDVRWAQVKHLAIVAVIGGAVAFGLSSDILPTWLGWSLLAPILLYVVAALSTGITASPRDLDDLEKRVSEELGRSDPPRRRRSNRRPDG